jgi:hypothetical protein
MEHCRGWIYHQIAVPPASSELRKEQARQQQGKPGETLGPPSQNAAFYPALCYSI